MVKIRSFILRLNSFVVRIKVLALRCGAPSLLDHNLSALLWFEALILSSGEKIIAKRSVFKLSKEDYRNYDNYTAAYGLINFDIGYSSKKVDSILDRVARGRYVH